MASCTFSDTVYSVTHTSGVGHTFLDPTLKVKQKILTIFLHYTLFSHYSLFTVLIKLCPNNGFE